MPRTSIAATQSSYPWYLPWHLVNVIMPSTWFPNRAVLVRMYFVSMYGQYYPTEGCQVGSSRLYFTATSDTIYDLACIIVLESSQSARLPLCDNFRLLLTNICIAALESIGNKVKAAGFDIVADQYVMTLLVIYDLPLFFQPIQDQYRHNDDDDHSIPLVFLHNLLMALLHNQSWNNNRYMSWIWILDNNSWSWENLYPLKFSWDL